MNDHAVSVFLRLKQTCVRRDITGKGDSYIKTYAHLR